MANESSAEKKVFTVIRAFHSARLSRYFAAQEVWTVESLEAWGTDPDGTAVRGIRVNKDGLSCFISYDEVDNGFVSG